jgi:flagellar motility protein MotE (MotC chaperone)
MRTLKDFLAESKKNFAPKVAKKALKDSSIKELIEELYIEEKELKTKVKWKVKFRNSPVPVNGAVWFDALLGDDSNEYLAAVKNDAEVKKTLKAVVDKKIADFEKALPPEKRAAGLAKLKEKNAK